MYYFSLQVSGGPVILDKQEMDLNLHLFKAYGQQRPGSGQKLPEFSAASQASQGGSSHGNFQVRPPTVTVARQAQQSGRQVSSMRKTSGSSSSSVNFARPPSITIKCPDEKRRVNGYQYARQYHHQAARPAVSSSAARLQAASASRSLLRMAGHCSSAGE